MSLMRKTWKKFKKQLEDDLGGLLGKGWTKKKFKRDLGPQLDKMDKRLTWFDTEVGRLTPYLDGMDSNLLDAAESHRLGKKILANGKTYRGDLAKVVRTLDAYADTIRDEVTEAIGNDRDLKRTYKAKAAKLVAVVEALKEQLVANGNSVDKAVLVGESAIMYAKKAMRAGKDEDEDED